MVIVKKKNYIGVKCEMDPIKWKIDYKGIAIKRRNYCNFVKTVYWNVIYPTLGVQCYTDAQGKPKMKKVDWDPSEGPTRALEALKDSLNSLVTIAKSNTAVDYTEFMKSASLKSNYKSDRLPHVQLAARMKERDASSAPRSGQRFSYVIINEDSRGNELYAKSEDPDFARENGLPLDYLFYLNNQIRKPLTTFLELSGRHAEIEDIFNTTEATLFDLLKKGRATLAVQAKKDILLGKRPALVAPLKKPKKQKNKHILLNGMKRLDSFFL